MNSWGFGNAAWVFSLKRLRPGTAIKVSNKTSIKASFKASVHGAVHVLARACTISLCMLSLLVLLGHPETATAAAKNTVATVHESAYEPQLVWAWNLNAPLNINMQVSDDFYGGEPKSLENKKKYLYLLNEWWNVTTRKEVLAAAHLLINSKVNDPQSMQHITPLLDSRDQEVSSRLLSIEIQNEVRQHQDTLTRHGLRGWDLARVQTLLGWAYMADLLTFREAREQALEAAAQTRKQFSSYEDMSKSYRMGYLLWTRNMDKYEKRKALLDNLLKDPDSPWVKQAW